MVRPDEENTCTSETPVACQAGASPNINPTASVATAQECGHACVKGDRHRVREQPGRDYGRHDGQTRRAHSGTQDAPEQGEDEALGQQLPGDAPPSGAERRPHGQLAGPRARAREQQVGDIGAAHEEDEADDAQDVPWLSGGPRRR